LTFQSTPAAETEKKNTMEKHRRESVAVRYLNAEEGLTMAALAFTDVLAFLCLPITGPIYLIYLAWHTAMEFLWGALQKCNNSSSLPPLVITSCNLTLQSNVPGTTVFNVLSFFDYTSYSALMTLVDTLHPITSFPIAFCKILWHVPIFYWNFYVTDKAATMPPRRNACLLRQGLKTVNEELQMLNTKFLAEQDLRDLMAEREQGEEEESGKQKRSKKRPEKGQENRRASNIDYGPRKEWEALKAVIYLLLPLDFYLFLLTHTSHAFFPTKNKQVCIDKEIDSYTYKLCFFKDVKQDATLLGRFEFWGQRATWHTTSFEGTEQEEEGVGRSKNGLISKKRKSKPPSKRHVVPKLFDEANKNTDSYYSTQAYSNGARCVASQSGVRSVEVRLECSPHTEILSVSELEVCSYTMIVSTPLACSEASEEESIRRLDKLGVFGFTDKSRA